MCVMSPVYVIVIRINIDKLDTEWPVQYPIEVDIRLLFVCKISIIAHGSSQ